MTDYDIAVIGAGAAGLAAGLALQKAGRSFTVLEARSRIGGRAFTDTATLGLPFDCGAHWLHAAAQNPFTKIADKLGFAYNSRISFDDWMLFAAGREAPERVTEEAGTYMDDVLRRIDKAGAKGKDVAFSDFIEEGNSWNMLVRQVIGQITSHDPEDCSTLDSYRYDEEGGDFPVEDGFGALVARNAANLEVTLSTPVTRIDWSGKNVRLETPRGTITARTIILSVPVNVLIAEGIRFEPALPVPLVQAFHDCPMGVSEKLAMLLDRPIDGLEHTYGDVVFPGKGPARTFNLYVNPFGRPPDRLAYGGFVGRGNGTFKRCGRGGYRDRGSGGGFRIVTAKAHHQDAPHPLGFRPLHTRRLFPCEARQGGIAADVLGAGRRQDRARGRALLDPVLLHRPRRASLGHRCCKIGHGACSPDVMAVISPPRQTRHSCGDRQELIRGGGKCFM